MKVFKNANFISCEDENRIANNLVEEEGRILFLGESLPEKFESAEQIDLGGKTVVPAFVDTHMHFESFSLFHSSLDCRDARNFSDLRRLIQEFIENQVSKKQKLVLGFGVSAHLVSEKRLPNRKDLDAITDKPLMIVKYDGHASVANSALIQKLPQALVSDPGFDAETGWFQHDSFYKVVNHITKSVSLLDVLKNMVTGADYLARKGVGLVHTAEGVGFPLDSDVDLMRLLAHGLPQEFRTFFQTMDLKKIKKRKLSRVGGCFATALDGCFGSEDAALCEPYRNNGSNKGVLFYDQARVDEFVRDSNRAGLQVAMHAIGDAAVTQALASFEKALKDHPRKDHRHIMIHADLMSEGNIKKAAELGIAIALQTPFLDWSLEPLNYVDSLIGERSEQLISLKSLIDAGVLIGNGSDAPCTIPDPVLGISAACNHPNPKQRISALDALRLQTHWGAKLSFDEKERGTLTEGKIADFVVLNENPLTLPVEKLKTLKVDDVYFSGVRYETKRESQVTLVARSIFKALMH